MMIVSQSFRAFKPLLPVKRIFLPVSLVFQDSLQYNYHN